MMIVLFVFALILGLWLWYYFVYTRTPEHALRSLSDACGRHDTAAVLEKDAGIAARL